MTSLPDEGRADDRNPLELLLDVGVYAPLGFALEFRRLVPELAEAGRRQVDFSRSLGRAALRTLSKAANDVAPTPSRSAPAHDPPEGGDATVVGYDDLNAKDVIALVGEASAPQRAWIRRREVATKNRKTVLAAIDRIADDRD